MNFKDGKINYGYSIYSPIRCRRPHGVTDAVPLSAENLRENVLLLQFSAYIRFPVKSLIETNKISNELIFSEVFRNINYVGSSQRLQKPIWDSFTLHATQCSSHFYKLQKTVIHFFIKLEWLSRDNLSSPLCFSDL